MSYLLSEQLGGLRTGNLSSLTEFYAQQRDVFSRWGRRQFGIAPDAAHSVLREVLLEFYDQVNDGRISRWPTDLRAHLYGVARQVLTATTTNSVLPNDASLPVREAGRRQLVLRTLRQLPSDSQLVLRQFYFHGSNFEKLAVKLGYANASVARRQKSDALRKLFEALNRAEAPATTELVRHLANVERSSDGLMNIAEQDEFDEQLLSDNEVRQACMSYEQYAADLRWAAGRETLRLRLESLDKRVAQRTAAQQRVRRQRRRQRLRLAIIGGTVVVALACLFVFWPRPDSPKRAWRDFDVADPGLPTDATARRPLLAQSMTLYRGGNYAAALHTLRRLPATTLGQDTFLYYNGVLLLRQEQAAQASNYFERVSRMPESALTGRAMFYLGLARWQQGQHPQAQDALKRAATAPADPYRTLARQALKEGDWKKD